MASAGEFRGASPAQTDGFGRQATPSPVLGRLNNRLSALEIQSRCLDPILMLPFELLEAIFKLALPSLDIGYWNREGCHSYMAALYTLRLVSTAWKDMVDRMPFLWAVISSTFPGDVNRTSLIRSGSSSLVIYFPEIDRQTDSDFREFLPIIKPHLQRCSFLALWLNSDFFVDEVPWPSLQRLATLKIFVDGWLADNITLVKNIEIPDEILENIRDIDLGGEIPVDWARTLGPLRNLRALTLDGVSDNPVDQEQIFSVLLASPGIETLVISRIEIQDPPSNLPPSTEPISLPELRSVTLKTGGLFTNNLLRRIQPPPDMAKLEINPINVPPRFATSFWEETMAPWVPQVQQLYNNCSERAVDLSPLTGCFLQAYPEYSLSIKFKGLSMTAALRWIHGSISAVDEGPGGLRIQAEHRAFEGNEILAIIQTIQGLTEIMVEPAYDLSRPQAGALLNVLGEPTADSIGTPNPRPTFPALQKLILHDWIWKLDDLMDMIQRRYSTRSTGGQQVPDLMLDISPLWLRLLPGIQREIISFCTVKTFRELDGVKEVRMGGAMEDGSLAVIWDEEESAPVWG
ncbi:hypothetical protein FRC01_006024 [Tulasnella sp. 417]|nr:hypothetical protein FRC01_006024 [Tulasnella sp. 417]